MYVNEFSRKREEHEDMGCFGWRKILGGEWFSGKVTEMESGQVRKLEKVCVLGNKCERSGGKKREGEGEFGGEIKWVGGKRRERDGVLIINAIKLNGQEPFVALTVSLSATFNCRES